MKKERVLTLNTSLSDKRKLQKAVMTGRLRETVFEIGPVVADDDWMRIHLGVHPRAVIRKLRMLRCKNGPAFELFEYEAEGARQTPPANSDVGAAHLGFVVNDMTAAVAHLHAPDVTVQGEPTVMQEGPSEGLEWVYFLAPWGMQLELVRYPRGMAVTRDNPSASGLRHGSGADVIADRTSVTAARRGARCPT